MITLSKVKDLRAAIAQQKQLGKRVALVPTMGNLHAGHLALVRKAREVADYVVTSIFVNPLQFGPGEDLDKYPRTLDADKAALVNGGNNLLYVPSVDQIYPNGMEAHTKVIVPGLTETHCGQSRPGHFTGVTTVVNILFNQVQPNVALFGEKDFQQVAVIRKMAKDLNLPITIETVPTVRESSGLAMSSRNGYLSPEERTAAATLYRVLSDTRARIEQGDREFAALSQLAQDQLSAAGFTLDYFSIAESETLAPASSASRDITLLVAAFLGKTRLIDNLSLSLPR